MSVGQGEGDEQKKVRLDLKVKNIPKKEWNCPSERTSRFMAERTD